MGKMLIDTLDVDQRRALENVREAAARIWARPLHRYFTDHTVAHSERIIGLLDGLTAGMMTTDKRLTSTEIFILLAAAFLHDIGMQNEKFAGGDLVEIREHHHEQTAEMIYTVFEDPANAFPIPLARDPAIVEAVALTAKGHRRIDLNTPEYDPLVYGGETLHPRLLAALLRFGDELDIDQRRVDLEQMKLMALPVESQLHWWKCHYVGGVRIEDEYIRVNYRFPQDRPDYEGLIVPLVEGEIRARHAALEEIFRAHAVKVALGRSRVRLMRLVQPLPPEVEALAREKVKGWKAGGLEAESGGGQKAAGTEPGTGGQAVAGKTETPVTPASTPRTVFDQGEQTVGTQINVAGDFVEQRPPGGATYTIHIQHAQDLAIGDGAQVVKGKTMDISPSTRGLELALYDSGRKDLTNRLTLSIPQKDPDHPLKATSVAFRLYLLNNGDRMARYVQIEMFVKAHFLAYPYESDPLIIEPADRWEIDRGSDDLVRCFFEGGEGFVCHRGKPRNLGLMKMQVPYGEADGGAVTINIQYSIITEEHTGSGLLIVWLQAAADGETPSLPAEGTEDGEAGWRW